MAPPGRIGPTGGARPRCAGPYTYVPNAYAGSCRPARCGPGRARRPQGSRGGRSIPGCGAPAGWVPGSSWLPVSTRRRSCRWGMPRLLGGSPTRSAPAGGFLAEKGTQHLGWFPALRFFAVAITCGVAARSATGRSLPGVMSVRWRARQRSDRRPTAAGCGPAAAPRGRSD
jgi:hypothetical protein